MTLHILHEGKHDKAYFGHFLKADLLKKYNCTKLKPFKYTTDASAKKHIKTIESENGKFLIFSDADFKNIGTPKPKNYKDLHKYLCEKFEILTNSEKLVFVVVEEIESWYLAGFDQVFCIKNKVKYHKNTEQVTAEMFKDLRIRPEQTEDQFRNWLIFNAKHYSIDHAKTEKRNNSFIIFCDAMGF